MSLLATAIVLLPALARSAAETGSNPALATFKSRCAGCHGDTEGRIPSKATLAEMAPGTVINTLSNGIMRPMAIGLSDREIQQIAIYLTGKQPTPLGPVGPDPNLCSKSDRVKLDVAKLAVSPSGYVVFYADDLKNLYAADALSGKVLWSTEIDKHPHAVITGSPTYYDGLLYVPVSSTEETVTNDSDYSCCSFRGSVVALDAETGKITWKTYPISEVPKPYRVSQGKQLLGPAGAAIWSAPTIDPKRGLVFATTGDSYTDVDTRGTDAVVAMDLKTGAIRWISQVTAKDSWLGGCGADSSPKAANCPSDVGQDADFGSSAALVNLRSGRQILVVGQKLGVVYAMDPDDRGNILWQTKVGNGGLAGGIQFGVSVDSTSVYAAVSDMAEPDDVGRPGITALRLANGSQIWHVQTPKIACSWHGTCSRGQSAAVSAMPGAVFSGALDGHLRAYSTANGAVLWDFDTAGELYDTVNGIRKIRGGALNGGGPTLAGGMVYQHSGYSGATGTDGLNLLFAFSVDGK
jgi:polyvinyl alcohol dehydrogenase (cytochrome)